MNDEFDDDGGDMYLLTDQDRALTKLASHVLHAALNSPISSWAQRVSAAKLMHVYSRLPAASSTTSVEVTFTPTRQRYGPVELGFWLTVGATDGWLKIQYAGHYYHPDTGGDSFTVFTWGAAPGNAPRYDVGSLGVVRSLVDPMKCLRELVAAAEDCRIAVEDDENPLLEDDAIEGDQLPTEAIQREALDELDDDDSDSEENEGASGSVLVNPVTDADRRLLEKFEPSGICRSRAGGAYGIKNCDGCGIDMSTVGLFVDGATPNGPWGNYCAACCLRLGILVGWGKGQLYAQQPDGSWQGVAGFDE